MVWPQNLQSYIFYLLVQWPIILPKLKYKVEFSSLIIELKDGINRGRTKLVG